MKCARKLVISIAFANWTIYARITLVLAFDTAALVETRSMIVGYGKKGRKSEKKKRKKNKKRKWE